MYLTFLNVSDSVSAFSLWFESICIPHLENDSHWSDLTWHHNRGCVHFRDPLYKILLPANMEICLKIFPSHVYFGGGKKEEKSMQSGLLLSYSHSISHRHELQLLSRLVVGILLAATCWSVWSIPPCCSAFTVKLEWLSRCGRNQISVLITSFWRVLLDKHGFLPFPLFWGSLWTQFEMVHLKNDSAQAA